MKKFKVGDRIKVREWSDMAGEFNVDDRGYIIFPDTSVVFNSAMKSLCGQIATITEIKKEDDTDRIRLVFDNSNLDDGWTFIPNMLTRIKEKIVIIADGKTTTAKLYSDNKPIKTATAKCSPDDIYDFTIGAKLAIDRLMNHKIEIGDIVKVTDWGELHSGYNEWVTTNASEYAVYYAYYADVLYNAEYETPNIEGELKVVAKASHGTAPDSTLCLIQDTEAQTCFLIDEKALKKTQ